MAPNLRCTRLESCAKVSVINEKYVASSKCEKWKDLSPVLSSERSKC